MILFLCPISFYVPIFNNFFNFKLCIKKKKKQYNLTYIVLGNLKASLIFLGLYHPSLGSADCNDQEMPGPDSNTDWQKCAVVCFFI